MKFFSSNKMISSELVQNKKSFFWLFFLFLFIVKFEFLSFSFLYLDEVSNIRGRIATNQKQELVVQNCQWKCMNVAK